MLELINKQLEDNLLRIDPLFKQRLNDAVKEVEDSKPKLYTIEIMEGSIRIEIHIPPFAIQEANVYCPYLWNHFSFVKPPEHRPMKVWVKNKDVREERIFAGIYVNGVWLYAHDREPVKLSEEELDNLYFRDWSY